MPGTWTVKHEFDSPQAVTLPLLTDVTKALDVLYGKVGLKSFKFAREQSNPLEYTYEWVASDDRKWKQTIVFDSMTDSDPSMSFEMKDVFFRESEFTTHRDLRRLMVVLVVNFGLKEYRVTT